MITRIAMIHFVLLFSTATFAEPVAWWNFDDEEKNIAVDIAKKTNDNILGNHWYKKGVKGNGLKFDGHTTRIIRAATKAPQLNEFTIEAWVAPQAYPWNWTAIVNQEKNHKEGFFFGISADGNIGLGAALTRDGQWHTCISKDRIEPLKWSHIAATINDSSMAVYINGKKSGEVTAQDLGWESLGSIRPAEESDLLIGMSQTKMYPQGTEREPSRKQLSWMVFDGLIDEIKIHDEAMTEKEIRATYEFVQPDNPQPLQWRQFPTEGSNTREFGASYTKLIYDEAWDSHWRMGEFSDVVVTFEKPVRVVFWRGINYAASYVTENNLWMGDQSLEGYSAWGCNEHMSDKQCRYSHVRIIENNPARIIVHWRYALADILYQIVNTDPLTKWGDWADEYFVIYPDAVVVRQQNLWSKEHEAPYSFWNEMEDVHKHQFQETILFNQPGTWPRDNIDPVNAMTVATMEGETFKCIWGKDLEFEEEEILNHDVVKNATIQLTNLKSKYKPFIIFEPGSKIEPWVGEDHSFWNHWPVAQLPSDGRFGPSNDRPSHTSFSNGVPVVHKNGNKHSSAMLYGLTEQPIEKLVPLARSWNHSAKLSVLDGNAKSKGYNKFQRAYELQCEKPGSKIQFKLSADKKNPLVNPAFVLENFGANNITLTRDGKQLQEKSDYRIGHEKNLNQTNLILWVNQTSTTPVTYTISSL